MKNYYEILEVSRNASKEIIEKAYKVLAKKYHPDLQEESNKVMAEERMKLINEAYEILSDDNKRKKYNIELENEEKRIEESKVQQINNYNDNNEEEYYEYEKPLTKEQIKKERKVQKEYREEQERQYRKYMRSLGYKVKGRWTLSRIISLLKALLVIIIILLIIWFLPPTHKLIIEVYEQNSIIRAIVNISINIFRGIGNGIDALFKGTFNKS